jgi:hypothetical protein
MSTQTVEFRAATGLTITAKLFAAGSDTEVASVTATEATNRKGTYLAVYTSVAAGEYQLIAFDPQPIPVASWWVTLTLSTATFGVYDKADTRDINTRSVDIQSRLPAALVSGRIDASVGAMASNVITAAAMASDASGEIADAVWDEPYAGHNIAGSFGKLLNTIRKANLAIEGEVTNAITPTTLTFSSNISATTSAYAHAVLLFVDGPLAGENSPIISYNNTNGVFVLEEPLTAAPSNGDEFVVIAGSHVHAIVDIQSGLATTTQLTTVETKIDTIDDFVDTEISAIKAKTDQLSFTVANQVDANALTGGGGGDSIIVTPVVAQTPVRAVATTITTFKGDRSAITVGVFDELDPVDLSALGSLEVCIQTKAGTDLQLISAANITISGTDSNYFSFSPNATAVGTVGRFMWSLRVASSSSKRVITYGAFVVEDAALAD